jgi:hypothetical protein
MRVDEAPGARGAPAPGSAAGSHGPLVRLRRDRADHDNGPLARALRRELDGHSAVDLEVLSYTSNGRLPRTAAA